MNSSKFRFTLDLHSTQSQYSIPVMLGDTGVTLLISITDGGVPYVITDGCLAKLSIKRPSGTYLEEFCTIKNNAVIEYPFRQNKNTCAEDGIHHCDVTLYSPDGAMVGGPSFTMVVSEKVVRKDDVELSTDDYTAVNAMITQEAGRQEEETKRVEAEVSRSEAEKERVEAEKERVEAEKERAEVMEEILRGELHVPNGSITRDKIAYAEVFEEHLANPLKLELYRSRYAFKKTNSNEKRIVNLERGYSDELFVTGDMNSVAERTVPDNALPYAEVKKIYGNIFKDSNGILHPKKALRVESCKVSTPSVLDVTLDTSDLASTMTIEKLVDGSLKFNGHTGRQEGNRSCKFATATLPAGTWGISARYVSGSALDSFAFYANSQQIGGSDDNEYQVFAVSEGDTVEFSVNAEIASGFATNYTIFVEITEGEWNGSEFVPAIKPIATLEIPEDVRDLEGYGFSAGNYLDLERSVFVKARALVNNTSVLLDKVEEKSVLGIISPDNFIDVVPGGIIRVIQDTGEVMACKCEVEFMLKGE